MRYLEKYIILRPKTEKFDKNTKSGILHRKGRLIEGVYVESDHLKYVIDDDHI